MRSSHRFFIAVALFVAVTLACGPGGRLTELIDTPTAPPATATPKAVETTAPATSVPATATTVATAEPIPASSASGLPLNSVVEIWALDANNNPMWTGSGSIVDSSGYVLTNAHVVTPDKEFPPIANLLISITQKEDEPPVPAYFAEVAVIDRDLDLAVLRITSDADGNPVNPDAINLPAIPLGDSDEVHLGMPLRILGYPGIGGDTITLTTGEIAGFTSEPGVKGRAYIKTSATIAGGNSGGAALSDDGALVAVPTELGSGSDADVVDCRRLADTNGDGIVDNLDACVPGGGFINALRPINLAKPLLAKALTGATEALPTPEPERHPIAPPENSGEVLFSDDFSNPPGLWGTTDGISFEGDAIKLHVVDINNYLWTTIGNEFDDFDFQVMGQKLGGPDDNSFGAIFRFQNAENFYTFEISSDGFFVVNKFENGTWIPLTEWQSSPVIHTGFDTNTIGVEGLGNQYTFFVNGVQVESLVDDTFAGGSIGLIASSYSEPDVLVAFDDVLVRVPGGTHQVEGGAPGVDQIGATIVLQDDFSAVDENWNLESTDTVERDIVDGEFLLQVNDTNTDGWSTYPLSLKDISIEVDAHKTAGPDVNNYGVMCRYQDSDNYYFLQLGSDGTYAISRYLNGEFTALVDWTASDAVRTGDAVNHIRAECADNLLSLYANDQLLATVEDSALTTGKFALAAGTYDDPGVQVRFDNLVVRTPSAEAPPTGELLMFEDFSDNSAGWAEGDAPEGSLAVQDGEYYLRVKISNYLYWGLAGGDWGNVAVDVDTRGVEGTDDNEFGVLCRYQDSDNYYQFGISGDGYYRLAAWVNGEFTELVPWDTSDSISLGKTANHLTVICDGSRLEMRVNGSSLISVTDDLLPQRGDVAVFAGTFDTPDTTVAFDNLNITRP